MRKIVAATEENKEEILKLYKIQLGREFCPWDDSYPGMKEIEFDLGRESLFVMIDGQEINADAVRKEDRIGAPSVRKVPQGFCVLSLIIVVLNRCSQWLCRFCLQGRLVLDMLLKVFFHFFGSGFTDDSNAVVVNFYALVSLSVLVFRCRYYDFLNKFVYQLGRESFEAGNLLRFVNKLL